MSIKSLLDAGARPHEIMSKLGVNRKEVMIAARGIGIPSFRRGASENVPKKLNRAKRLLKLKQSMTYAQIGKLEGVSRQCIQQWIACVIPTPKPSERCNGCGARRKLHRHHESYKDARIVILCCKCHRKADIEKSLANLLESFLKRFPTRTAYRKEAMLAGFAPSEMMRLSSKFGIKFISNTHSRKKHPVELINWKLPILILAQVWKFTNIRSVWTTRKRVGIKDTADWSATNRAKLKLHQPEIDLEKEKANSWFESGGFEAIRKKEWGKN